MYFTSNLMLHTRSYFCHTSTVSWSDLSVMFRTRFLLCSICKCTVICNRRTGWTQTISSKSILRTFFTIFPRVKSNSPRRVRLWMLSGLTSVCVCAGNLRCHLLANTLSKTIKVSRRAATWKLSAVCVVVFPSLLLQKAVSGSASAKHLSFWFWLLWLCQDILLSSPQILTIFITIPSYITGEGTPQDTC